MRIKYYFILVAIQLIILLIAVFNQTGTINHITIRNSYQFTYPISGGEIGGSDTKTIDSKKIECPLYKPPELKAEPELSLRELEKIDPKDPEALDEAIMEHISDLTDYIRAYGKQVQESYKAYLKKCQK